MSLRRLGTQLDRRILFRLLTGSASIVIQGVIKFTGNYTPPDFDTADF